VQGGALQSPYQKSPVPKAPGIFGEGESIFISSISDVS
jgi:hypothetical protein